MTEGPLTEKKTKQQRAAELRENLRNGRNRPPDEPGQAVDGTGETLSRVSEPHGEPLGATFQDARGTARHLTPTGGKPAARDRRNRDDKRGTTRQPERVGRSDRRAEESNSGATPDNTAVEHAEPASQRPTVGRLEANETISEPSTPKIDLRPDAMLPMLVAHYKEDYRRTQREGQNVYALIDNPAQFITPDEFKQLKTRKESETSTNSVPLNSVSTEKPAFFKGGVLSKQEADELYEPLVAALSDGFGYLDKLIWMECPQLDERPIWSNTTTREDQAIAKILLKRGQKSAAAAAAVRTMVDSADYVMVGMLIAPRVRETVQAMRERPAKPRKKKFTLLRTAQHEN